MGSESPTLVRQPARPRASLKRDVILTAAIDEFSERGYEGSSMDRIAARAGVSKMTIYAHFVSKDQLLDAIWTERLPSFAATPYDPELPLIDQLVRIGEAYLDVLSSDVGVAMARVSIARTVRDPSGTWSASSDARERMTAVVREWIEAATRDGQLTVDDSHLAVNLFLGALQSGSFWPRVLGGTVSRRERAKYVHPSAEMFLRYYAKPGI